MKFFTYFLLIFIISLASGSHSRHRKNVKAPLNDRPIIGALTQEVTGKLIDYYGNHVSYLAASYVKHLESAGARVVPIWIGKDKKYYRSILSLVNGAFLPGGASEFNVTDGYADAGNYIMQIADEFNAKGDYFPVWGTCLGFELLGWIANGNKEIRDDCSSHNEAIPLKLKPVHFLCHEQIANWKVAQFPEIPVERVKRLPYIPKIKSWHLFWKLMPPGLRLKQLFRRRPVMLELMFFPDFRKSKLFKDMPADLVQILSKENSTMNFHQYCLTEKTMEKAGLLKTWTVLSTNVDENGLEYISTMEHKTRPYWGVQFHPEKSAYEWNPKHNTPHTANAIRANQYFADFFVSQARKNFHKFPSVDQERLYLIYNFPMTFGKPESTFTQLYFFD